LNALARKWRQKARSSAKGFAGAPRPEAETGREADVIVAMTRPLFFHSRLISAKRRFSALKTSFRPIY
jgi:hypothetical protein